MPAMPRAKSKATKIAYKILGEPLNLQKKKKGRPEKNLDKQIFHEETSRAR